MEKEANKIFLSIKEPIKKELIQYSRESTSDKYDLDLKKFELINDENWRIIASYILGWLKNIGIFYTRFETPDYHIIILLGL